MNIKIIIALIVIAVLLVGGYFLLKGNNMPVQTNSQLTQTDQSNNTNQDTNTPVTQPEVKHEIIYTDSGFSPATLTIKVGDTVTFKNESSSGMWVGSANHPSHTVYSGTSLQQHCPDPSNTSFDECKSDGPGASWSFTFTKAGSWGYHNHVKANFFGKVIVE